MIYKTGQEYWVRDEGILLRVLKIKEMDDVKVVFSDEHHELVQANAVLVDCGSLVSVDETDEAYPCETRVLGSMPDGEFIYRSKSLYRVLDARQSGSRMILNCSTGTTDYYGDMSLVKQVVGYYNKNK